MDSLTERTIQTKRNYTYRYYTSPSTSPPPKHTLLLCHGFPDSAALFQYMVPDLLKLGVRLIIPDLIGYGGTSKPTDPAEYNWTGQSQDLNDILAHEGVDGNIIVLGHDWGAALAQRYYMLNKPLCVGLTTLAVALMPPFTSPFDLDAINNLTEKAYGYPIYAYWHLFTAPDSPQLIESRLETFWYVLHANSDEWMKKMFCVPGAMRDLLERDDTSGLELKAFAKDERFKNEWMRSMKEGGMTGPTNWYRALAFGHQSDIEKDLDPNVPVPYLFIGCDSDAVCRTDAIEGAKKAGWTPDLTVRELHSGHWCTYEVPDQVMGIMGEWMREKGLVG